MGNINIQKLASAAETGRNTLTKVFFIPIYNFYQVYAKEVV